MGFALGVLALIACNRETSPPTEAYEYTGTPTIDVDDDDDGFDVATDCNDKDPEVHPGATEHCDGIDENCNGVEDDGAVDATEHYADVDGDGFGAGAIVLACDGTDGLVENSDDCDDTLAESYPRALELCDGLDNDCDGLPEAPDSLRPWYFDADGDGYGDPASVVFACDHLEGSTRTALDCDDADAATHPDAPELCDDAVDSDCSGRPSNGCDPKLLRDVEIAVYSSEEIYDALGDAVANAGDVNGDGRDDLAVGAPHIGYVGDAIPDNAGAAFIVHGADEYGADTIVEAYDAAVWGTSEYASVGARVAGVDDLDGDGYDDVVVYAYDDASCEACGDTHAFFGPVTGDLTVADADLHLWYQPGAASRGDFDGDAQDDLVYGGLGTNGTVYFFSGPIEDALPLSSPAATFRGDEATAGSALSALADADGDGLADLAIGAPFENDGAGAVFVLHGPLDVDTTTDDATAFTSSHAGGRSPNRQKGDELGTGCQWAGDLDGDGHLDVAMSAIRADENGHDAGAVYVVYGPHDTSIDIRDSDALVYGSDDGHYLGYGLAPGADLDGDGFGDLVVGDMHEDVNGPASGAVLVFYGPLYGRRSGAAADVLLAGSGDWARAGFALDVLDFDGDSAPEVLLGAPDDAMVGRAYVVANSAF
jgi:hypothetical protein